MLFGSDERHHETIFRAGFHQPPPVAIPTALRGALRLRIAAADPALLGLPWRLTSWNERQLAKEGWVFLPALAEDPTRELVTAAPSDVLLVAPKDPDGRFPGDVSHLDVLEQTLNALWPSREFSVRRAHARAQLQNALAGQLPHLVYVFASAETRRGQLCLLLDSPSGHGQRALALDDLARQIRESPRPPSIVYWNTCGAVVADPLQVFRDHIPLVVWRRLPGRGEDAMNAAGTQIERRTMRRGD